MDGIDLSIVIPAYRESQKIAQDVRAAQAFLQAQKLRGEIIVVDDGSADDTARVARALTAEHANLHVIAYTKNRGKGHALRFGILHASGRNVMFADAGLCVPYEIAHIGLTMIDLQMCDIAHGSRRMRGSIKRAQPLYRRLGSKVFGVAVHVAMGIPFYISDTQCGFKIYRRDVASRLYGELFTDGFMFDTEVILRALKAGYRILEFPVLWSNDSDTRYDPIKGTVRNIAELAKIRFGLARGLRPSTLSTDAHIAGANAGKAVLATEGSTP